MEQEGTLSFRAAPTKRARVEAKSRLGDLGDPWVPINRKEGKALTVPAGGFTYKRTQAILLGADWSPGAALELRPTDPEAPYFVATALVRGQGRTDGLHSRQIRLPGRARRLLATAEGRQRIERISQERIDTVASVQKRVLRPALRRLFDSAPDPWGLTSRWTGGHDRAVDRIFFEHLWAGLDQPEHEAGGAWQHTVLDLARDSLEHAIADAPLPSARRFEAIARADGLFGGLARKHFPDAVDTRILKDE